MFDPAVSKALITLVVALAASLPGSNYAQVATTDRLIVEADRIPNAESSAPFDIHTLNQDDLQQAPQLRLDDILRAEVPGFSLFRRNSSLTANPTTQGVTLRNFGPNGAGRTLVLLDGIPLNDPFAGYVLWSQVPAAMLDSIVVSGGGAGLFGNEALAGTIFLNSRPATATAAYTETSVGNHDTYETAIEGTIARGSVSASVFADYFSTSGYPVIRGNQRGPVDNTASADSAMFDARVQWQLNDDTSLRLETREFHDERGNGTILTHNDTLGVDTSAVLTIKFPAESAELQLSVYGQHRKYRSTFSSINSARTIETPALDQFDVPANATGASAVWTMVLNNSHTLTGGADFRWVEGETNEAFVWNGHEFTRMRNAGGEESFVGVFVEDTWSATPQFTILGGFRYDHWELFDGFRRESNRQTGIVSLDSNFSDRSGDEFNGRLGARFEPVKTVALRAAVYTGFRVPTLNELYRPFRVGNDVTEANPDLDPEKLLGGEAGVEWQITDAVQLSVTGFINSLHDAIGNITIGHGPGTFDPGGFIPAGGVLRQRQNLDQVLAPGFEATLRWHPIKTVTFEASYLFTHATIESAADPALEGKLLPQTPEHSFLCSIDWTPNARWVATVQTRYTDRQFDDDENFRQLRSFVTVDASLTCQLTKQLSATIKVQNLFDEEIQSAKSADGIVSLGAPRLVTLQLRCQL